MTASDLETLSSVLYRNKDIMRLTLREEQLMCFLGRGMKPREVVAAMGVSDK